MVSYIALDLGENDRARLVDYGVNFFNHVEVRLVVCVLHSRPPPRHVRELASGKYLRDAGQNLNERTPESCIFDHQQYRTILVF